MSDDLKSRVKNVYFITSTEEAFDICFDKEIVKEKMDSIKKATGYSELKEVLI